MISSYHPGFASFFSQVEGVKSVLEPEKIALDIEFMDTKRFDGRENIDRFTSLLRAKLDRLPPYDAIITADDAASKFAIEHQRDFFFETPIVFCGVNDINMALEQDKNPWITGVIEDVSMRGTLELIKRFHPSVEEIVAISDGTISGQADTKKFLSDSFILENIGFSVVSLKDLSWREAWDRLKAFDEGSTVFLLLSAYVDKEGVSKSFDEGLEYLCKDVNCPIYHLWSHGIGKGLLGGRIISQREQGKSAAKMIIRILRGTPVETIDVLTESPNRYMFDYAQLERFNIPSYKLPENSTVIGAPIPFHECSPVVFWTIVAIAGFLVPITLFTTYLFLKNRKSALAFQESEKRYKALITNASEGILVTSLPKRDIMYVNPAMAQMLGYSPEDLYGKNASKIHPDNSTGVGPQGEPGKTDIEFMRFDGSIFIAEESWTKITVDGKPALLGFVNDVTEKRKTEEELKRHKDELESIVKERTAELERAKMDALSLAAQAQEDNQKANETLEKLARSEKMLIDARDAANEANRAKSDFLATMSHEIRTPLNAVIGLSQLLLREDLTEKERDWISKIDSSGKMLLNIIDDILDFSKIEAGKLEIEKIPFSLEEIVSDALEAISLEAEKKNIELHVDISPELPPSVVGDPFRIRQILNNLLSNSVKFTESGDIVVSLKNGEKTDKRLELIFSVKDTGIGMTENQLKRIFDPFMQADSSTSRKYRGTGLGLSISQKLCELMGGYIRGESRIGKGSTFTFSVIAGIPEEEEQKSVKSTREAKIRATDFRVLVVDDNPIARKILREILNSMSFKVETVSSGKDAIARLKAKEEEGYPFNLVIVDWKMPEMDGIETARQIKKMGLKQTPKFLMVTGHHLLEVQEEAKEAGFEDILAKPIQPSTLLDSILSITTDVYTSRHTKVENIEKREEQLKGTKILLVEDNEINMEVAKNILEQAGATITPAENGKKAISLLSRASFDLVLMDVQMPEMDGFEATKTIRNEEIGNSEYRRIPIVAMTAHAMSGDKEKCIESGMDDHVSKPIDPDVLVSTASRWIFGKKEEKKALSFTKDLPEYLKVRGIDPTLGMHRTGSDIDGFLRLVGKFIEQYRDSAHKVREALNTKDDTKALWELHSIKGTSGNLGLVELQEASEILESAIRKDQNNVTTLADIFEEIHTETVKNLKNISLKDKKSSTDKKPKSPVTDYLTKLEELVPLLEKRQPQPVISMLEENVWPEDSKEETEKILEAVKKYRFEEALSILDELRRDLP